MLTKDDIDQLRQVIREEVEAEAKQTREALQTDILQTKLQMKEGQHGIEQRLKNVEIKANKIDKTVDAMLRLLDREQMTQRKRIERIERHVDLPPYDGI